MPINIETEELRIEIAEENGSLVQLTDKSSGVDLISDARLAEIFTLVYSDELSQANEIRSVDQAAPQISRRGSSLLLIWAGPLKGAGADHNISVDVQIEVAGATVRWTYAIANRSDVRIDECRLVRIGGIDGYGDRATTRLVVPVAGSSAGRDLFHDFRSASGHSQELGTPAAENLFMYPGDLPMPWADLASDDKHRGLLFSAVDDLPRFRCLQVAVHPGVGHLRRDTWPTGASADDVPRGLCLSWVAFPYLRPGNDFSSPTVTLSLHDGDWHQAGIEYRRWFEEHKVRPRPSSEAGIRACGAIQDTMFLLPEGNINLRYSQMPRLGRRCRSERGESGLGQRLGCGWPRLDVPVLRTGPSLGDLGGPGKGGRRVPRGGREGLLLR